MQAKREKIVILTGAGISAESGLGTFRDEGGLWAQHAIEDVATPEGFARNPRLVHDFYNARRIQAAEAKANKAHQALAQLQEHFPGEVVIVTQNVDSLHEKGGARNVIHMHGVLEGALCATCDHRWPAPDEMEPETTCPHSSAPSARPDIVWFGEIPYAMEEIEAHLSEASLFVAIGTSAQVYPAAGFVEAARSFGAETLEINLEPSDLANRFHSHRFGPATETVPEWVAALLT
ncbi:NAD-dependent deacetylase [Roseobacter sp. SK209-2-6]|uniref:NAD-dependent deacylase n=1 Tax=Roseobacter sp. SK209-2-6 TaxID=388739 RepID=UPI0000F3ED0D|nr:NAD-dependent deacylase [Roseobacter sp. SK209-2-6]EBA15491.1 NAD-dependent deacetylase [Roseobacter sp. SK209-2-6]